MHAMQEGRRPGLLRAPMSLASVRVRVSALLYTYTPYIKSVLC
jgi:hypothetical protein